MVAIVFILALPTVFRGEPAKQIEPIRVGAEIQASENSNDSNQSTTPDQAPDDNGGDQGVAVGDEDGSGREGPNRGSDDDPAEPESEPDNSGPGSSNSGPGSSGGDDPPEVEAPEAPEVDGGGGRSGPG